MVPKADIRNTMSEEVRKFLSEIGRKGGSRVTPKKLAHLKRARAAYQKQRRENKETQ